MLFPKWEYVLPGAHDQIKCSRMVSIGWSPAFVLTESGESDCLKGAMYNAHSLNMVSILFDTGNQTDLVSVYRAELTALKQVQDHIQLWTTYNVLWVSVHMGLWSIHTYDSIAGGSPSRIYLAEVNCEDEDCFIKLCFYTNAIDDPNHIKNGLLFKKGC